MQVPVLQQMNIGNTSKKRDGHARAWRTGVAVCKMNPHTSRGGGSRNNRRFIVEKPRLNNAHHDTPVPVSESDEHLWMGVAR